MDRPDGLPTRDARTKDSEENARYLMGDYYKKDNFENVGKVIREVIDEEILTSLLKKAEMPESEITRIIFEAKLKTAMKRKLSSDFFKIKKEKEKANES